MYTIIGVEELGDDGLWRGVRLYTQFRDVRVFCPRYASAHGVVLRVWHHHYGTRVERDAELSLMTDQLVANLEERAAMAREALYA